MKIKDRFYKSEKTFSLYRKEGQERGDLIKNWSFTEKAQEYARKIVIDELFYYECSPEEWEEMADEIGFTREELVKMPFKDFVIAVHKYFLFSIDYEVQKYEPGEGFGGATPYSD